MFGGKHRNQTDCATVQARPDAGRRELHKKRTDAIYYRLAGLYSFFRMKDGLDTVLELMELSEGQKVLDVGTGPGVYALHVAQNWPSCSVHGLDRCERFVRIAARKARRRKVFNAHFAVGDAESVHYGAELFDRILFAGTLVLVPDKAAAIAEAHRVLKPGGVAIFKELLQKKFLHKELFYIFWRVCVKGAGLVWKDVRGITRSDYEGHTFSQEEMCRLLRESSFSDYRVFSKGTRLYAVCRK